MTPGRFRVVAMAASAGGLHALGTVLTLLPQGFPVPILVVQHLDPHHRSLMAPILGRRSALTVMEAVDGHTMQPACVYVAPPDRHLLVSSGGVMSLSRSELVHFVRPSADLLFESVAASFANHAIAIVLSGTGTDGAMGVTAIKKMGGLVIAQDSAAEFFGMPGAAIQTGAVDLVLPLEAIAERLVGLVAAEVN